MRLTFNPELNIAYIRFLAKRGKMCTVCVSDELDVDMAPDGSIYGLELLNAKEQLGVRRSKKLVVENGVSGESVQLAVASCGGRRWGRSRGRKCRGMSVWRQFAALQETTVEHGD